MKKTYINPDMEIVMVATQQMLAVSGDSVSTDSTPVDPGSTDAPGFDDLLGF